MRGTSWRSLVTITNFNCGDAANSYKQDTYNYQTMKGTSKEFNIQFTNMWRKWVEDRFLFDLIWSNKFASRKMNGNHIHCNNKNKAHGWMVVFFARTLTKWKNFFLLRRALNINHHLAFRFRRHTLSRVRSRYWLDSTQVFWCTKLLQILMI